MARHWRDLEKEQYWRLAIDEHGGSGLSVRAFCHREGLSEASFYAWRRELRQRDDESASGTATNARRPRVVPKQAKTKSTTKPAAGPSLVEVVTRPSLTAQPVEIETPTGFTIRLSQPVDGSSLATVLGLVMPQAGT